MFGNLFYLALLLLFLGYLVVDLQLTVAYLHVTHVWVMLPSP